jgi:serine/threonine protein kinase
VDDRLSKLFIDCLKDPDLSPELIASIQRFKATTPNGPGSTAKLDCGKLPPIYSSIVRMNTESNGNLTAVKTVSDPHAVDHIQWETSILKKLNHPLVLRHLSTQLNPIPTITTEFVPNGSLKNHLFHPALLQHPTKITKIIAEIVLAMRYIHSQDIIHRKLTPNKILLDWNWNIRIANFRHSIFDKSPVIDVDKGSPCDAHYCAPECYDNINAPENDVFSFGLILYELIVGQPVFSTNMTQQEIAAKMIMNDWQPEFPHSVRPRTKELICDCLAVKYWERPSFSDILDRMEEMRFKLMVGVNSSKMIAFVNNIKTWEVSHGIEIKRE